MTILGYKTVKLTNSLAYILGSFLSSSQSQADNCGKRGSISNSLHQILCNNQCNISKMCYVSQKDLDEP